MVLDMIVLRDAQLDMERQANGIRNWRLGHPDDTGPAARARAGGRRRSAARLHTVHGGIGARRRRKASSRLPPASRRAGSCRPAADEAPRLRRYVTRAMRSTSTTAVSGRARPRRGRPRMSSLRGTREPRAACGSPRKASATTRTPLGDIDVDATLASHGDGPAVGRFPRGVSRARAPRSPAPRPLQEGRHDVDGDRDCTRRSAHRTALDGRRALRPGSMKDASGAAHPRRDPARRRVRHRRPARRARRQNPRRPRRPKPQKPANPPKRRRSRYTRDAGLPTAPPARVFDADVDLKNARIVGSPDDPRAEPAPACDARVPARCA